MSNVDDRLRQLLLLEQRINDAAAVIEQARHPGNGGGPGGTMKDDAWKKAVDDHLKRNADDLRSLLKGVIGAGLVIVGMIVGLYVYTGSKTDSIANQLSVVRIDQERLRADVRSLDASVNGKLDRIVDRATR